MIRRCATRMILMGMAWVAMPTVAERLVVANAGGGQDDRGVILWVDSESGHRELISDFGDSTQGPLGLNMRRIATESSNDFLVVDPFVGTAGQGALFRVDVGSGQRILLSDFGDATQGPLSMFPIGVAIDGSDRILVTSNTPPTLSDIDPTNGQRTTLSDFTNPAQGPLGVTLIDVTINSRDQILVGDTSAGTGSRGAIFGVDSVTGQRTILSDFGEPTQGPLDDINSVVFAANDEIFATTREGPNGFGAVYRVDPIDGQRTLLADFGDSDLGIVYDFRPTTLVLDAVGTLQVIGNPFVISTSGLLINVDPTTGQRTLLSDFGDAAQGAVSSAPTGITRQVSTIFADGFESGNTSSWSATFP